METYAKVGTLYDVGLTSMGVAILMEHLRTAALALVYATTPTYRRTRSNSTFHSTIHQSVAFIQGSGLESVIAAFDLDYDPDTLRETFYTWAAHQRTHHSVPSSSATTRDD